MGFNHEVSLLAYFLDSCGDKEAIDALKSIESESIRSYSIRSAIDSFKHHLQQGIWPDSNKVLSGLDSIAQEALKDALGSAERIVEPIGCLGAIRRDWERIRSMEMLSRGYHAISECKSSLEDVIKGLGSIKAKTSGWQEWDFADIVETVQNGEALDPHVASRNLLVTGIESFDKAIASPCGCYGVIGAMPGVGKTSLMIQAGMLSAISGTRTMCMSLETPKTALGAKAFATFSAANDGNAYVGSLLRKGGYRLGDSLAKQIHHDMLKIVFHPAGLPWVNLEAKIRVMADLGYELFIIDYFTLIEPSDNGKKSEHSLAAEMSKSVKALASELNVAIILVVQPNSEVKYGERPDPSQLATSKQVFRDYDFGIYLWSIKEKNEVYQAAKGNHLRLLKAWVHKNRLFNSEDSTIKSEPEVWIEAELRRNWFKEIAEPAACMSEIDRDNEKLRRNL